MSDNPQFVIQEGSSAEESLLQKVERSMRADVDFSNRALAALIPEANELGLRFFEMMRGEPDYRMSWLKLGAVGFFGGRVLERFEAAQNAYYRLDVDGVVGLPHPGLSNLMVGLLTSTFSMSANRGDDLYMLRIPGFKPGIGTVTTNLESVTELICSPKVAEKIFQDINAVIREPRNNIVYGPLVPLFDNLLPNGCDMYEIDARIRTSSAVFSPRSHQRVIAAGRNFTEGLGLK